jgi:putative ATPase
MVDCPICSKPVRESDINRHIDSNCTEFIDSTPPLTAQKNGADRKSAPVASFFKTPASKKLAVATPSSSENPLRNGTPAGPQQSNGINFAGSKRAAENEVLELVAQKAEEREDGEPPAKRTKTPSALQRVAPLAERMRPRTLDEVYGQELVGPNGVLRGLIESNRVPSMILWGGAGTGKTTIARLIANMVGSRFVEINSTSSGVGECKKIFADARGELGLTGRSTILFCDEIHRFSKAQQDVFLGPVESGQITLIGATTENPSFKVQTALLSRCRTFTLAKLTDLDITVILRHALEVEGPNYQPSPLVDEALLTYLAAFADGDARTALNLLELAMDLSKRPNMTTKILKSSLTKTLVYDRAGDQHYDTISAFHKSIRGSDPDAALYYLARMIQSGEDPLYIARRMIVIASEDVGLADNSMLPLATAAYTAAEKIGMPEARINLAHVAVALALAKKSTRSYRALGNATAALQEPGVAGLPVPIHLRNAPTRLMKEMGYGKEYKYNPNYKDGKVVQDYLPEKLKGKRFLEDEDLGTDIDPAWLED